MTNTAGDNQVIVDQPAKFFSKSRLLLWSLIVAILVMAAIGIYSITSQQEEFTVLITETGFKPQNLIIAPGTKVTWKNIDNTPRSLASDPHPEHNTASGLLSGELGIDQTFSFVFNDVGKYTYHDESEILLGGTVIVSK